MPGLRLNVNERSLYTRKMIAEKKMQIVWLGELRVYCGCMCVWADVSARELFLANFFLLNDQCVAFINICATEVNA